MKVLWKYYGYNISFAVTCQWCEYLREESENFSGILGAHGTSQN